MLHVLFTLILAAAASFQLLPAADAPDGWSASGDPLLFEGGALFEHINGGADRYHELGFVDLVVQSYLAGDEEIQLEIYDMGSADGAATIFSEVMEGVETGKDFGQASTRDDYQIAFHEGRYYVSVLAFTDGEGVAEGMAALAKSVEAKIRAS